MKTKLLSIKTIFLLAVVMLACGLFQPSAYACSLCGNCGCKLICSCITKECNCLGGSTRCGCPPRMINGNGPSCRQTDINPCEPKIHCQCGNPSYPALQCPCPLKSRCAPDPCGGYESRPCSCGGDGCPHSGTCADKNFCKPISPTFQYKPCGSLWNCHTDGCHEDGCACQPTGQCRARPPIEQCNGEYVHCWDGGCKLIGCYEFGCPGHWCKIGVVDKPCPSSECNCGADLGCDCASECPRGTYYRCNGNPALHCNCLAWPNGHCGCPTFCIGNQPWSTCENEVWFCANTDPQCASCWDPSCLNLLYGPGHCGCPPLCGALPQ